MLTREGVSLRIGAVCLIVGSIAVLAFRIAHGDLPTDTGRAALAYVAAHPMYPVVHFGDWLGVLAWAGGLIALSVSLTHRAAWVIGVLGSANVLVGAAIHITEFSIDGYALPTLAKAWAAAAPQRQPELEHGARLALVIIGGPSTSALMILWGFAVVLFGLAVLREGYSRWLSWAGVGVGTAIFVLGTIQFLDPNEIYPGVWFYGGGTVASQLWSLVLGAAMWRRAGSVSVRETSHGADEKRA